MMELNINNNMTIKLNRITALLWIASLVLIATAYIGRARVDGQGHQPENSNTTYIHAAYQRAETLEQLEEVSDGIMHVVVLGKDRVIGGGLDKIDTPETIFPSTIYRARIIETVKGRGAIGEIVEIAQLGGTVDGHTFKLHDSQEIKVGSEYLLFGMEYADRSFSVMFGGNSIARKSPIADDFMLPSAIGKAARENPVVKLVDNRVEKVNSE